MSNPAKLSLEEKIGAKIIAHKHDKINELREKAKTSVEARRELTRVLIEADLNVTVDSIINMPDGIFMLKVFPSILKAGM